MAAERIGRCDLCGVVDHHLVDGECASCRDGRLALTPTTVPNRASARMLASIYRRLTGGCDLRGRVRVARDAAGNPTIRIAPEGRQA